MQSQFTGTIERYTEPTVSKAQPRVALLTNILPPYLLPVFTALARQVGSLRILLSAATENERPWSADWNGLDVSIQKSWKLNVRQKHPQGFTAIRERHIPYDTLPRLIAYEPNIVISAQLGFRTVQSIVYRRTNRKSRLIIWVDASEHTEKRIGLAVTIARRQLLRNADAVLVIGRSGGRYLEKLGVSRKRIVEVPYVTDFGPSTGRRAPVNPVPLRRLLYVGRLIDGKGVLPFVRELVLWCMRNTAKSCELWIVGDGARRNEIAQMNIPANLSLTLFGNVPYKSLPNVYAQATVTVLPTLADTWGLVVNESLACGVPVLGSLYSQAVEMLVQHGTNGWTYWPDASESTQRALDQALNVSAEELDRMRVSARESVKNLTPQYAASCFARAIEQAQAEREV